MESTVKLLLFLAATLAPGLLGLASGAVFYVDGSQGNNSNDGLTAGTAFKTIQTCVDALKDPGDECHIRAGRYHEEVQVSGKKGSPEKPMVIRGYQDEIPVIDGTIPLNPKRWKRNRARIYNAVIDRAIWQLFVDDVMMTNARWPNALWSDKTVFLNKYWAKSSAKSTRGQMIDDGSMDLAGSRLDATGAMAILNIGSFNTFTAVVESHQPGSNSFSYNDTFGDIKFKAKHNQYFLEDKLDFLDQAGEWFYDKSTQRLYVKTYDGKKPKNVRGKVSAYLFSFCSTV